MAQLMPRSLASSGDVLLPTVTCSTCSLPVPMSELGDHICPPMSQSPPGPRRIPQSRSQPSSSLAPPTSRQPPQSQRNAPRHKGPLLENYSAPSPHQVHHVAAYGPPGTLAPQPPTQTGGPAGMAGVGRRGFAAAAAATMFATGPQSKRGGGPRYKDPPPSNYRTGRATPPLSSSTPYSSSTKPSPHSPSSPTYLSNHAILDSRTPSPVAPRPRDRHTDRPPDPPTKQALPNLAMPTPTRQIDLLTNSDNTNSKMPFLEKYKQAKNTNASIGSSSAYSSSSVEAPQAFTDSRDGLMYKETEDTPRSKRLVDALKRQTEKEAVEQKQLERERERQLERERDRHWEKERAQETKKPEQNRLPIANERYGERTQTRPSDEESESPYALGASLSMSSTSSSVRPRGRGRSHERNDKIVFPSSPSPESSPARGAKLKPSHTRSRSKSVGVMDKIFDDLLDRNTSSPISPTSPGFRDDWDDDAYPTRSLTTPTSSSKKPPRDQATTRRRPAADKVCVKCGKKIVDGKWIQIDAGKKGSGGVLCEMDWKMMYLPKCRRCDRPIEGQALGSSDGQIKGKYHPQCFNCDTCQKPFPDKSFYVFDGKPFCAYHYHQENNSLCSSARCGRPIEGPCALAPNGDRYHPEHFTCEYPGGCRQRLEEYWEVDGVKLCDRHALSRRKENSKAKALRRTTRFVDLSGPSY